MAKLGFTKHTYEVFVHQDGKWNLAYECKAKAEAMEQAEELLSKPKVAGVRVTAIDDAKGTEEVVHEDMRGLNDAIKPVAVDTAPVCETPDAVYDFPARQTIGRVIRQFLDSQGVSALELLFDAGRLNMLERMDAFFSSAMGMVAAVQAKATGTKPVERSDALYSAFGKVRDHARENREALSADGELLAASGLAAVLSKRGDKIARLGALARYMGTAGDWGDKLKLVLKLADGAPGADGVALLDGAAAEILDGAEAVKDILGGQKDTGSALMGLAQLAQGRYRPPPHAGDALVALAERLRDAGWENTRAVLFDRVARGLGGTRPLTREGGDAERELFIPLIREMGDEDGLSGGPAMVLAVLLRARITMAGGGENLPTGAALEQILYLLPSRAARMGVLLDACRTELWERHNPLIMGQLSHLVGQVRSIREMVPDGTTPEQMERIVAGLTRRIDADDMPHELRESLGAAFSGLLKAGKGAPPAPRENDDKGTRAMPTDTERKTFQPGTVIFEEGDAGDAAFIVVEGSVEIVRGNHVLARVGKGEIIGELALFDNQPRMATARAADEVQLITVSQENLKHRIERLDKTDRVMRMIMETLVRRLRGG